MTEMEKILRNDYASRVDHTLDQICAYMEYKYPNTQTSVKHSLEEGQIVFQITSTVAAKIAEDIQGIMNYKIDVK